MVEGRNSHMYNCILRKLLQNYVTSCLKSCTLSKTLQAYVIPWIGSLMEEKFCILCEIPSMAVFDPFKYWKYKLATFYVTTGDHAYFKMIWTIVLL
jgi:hypothetical protein